MGFWWTLFVFWLIHAYLREPAVNVHGHFIRLLKMNAFKNFLTAALHQLILNAFN
jgi:hypothetical protein